VTATLLLVTVMVVVNLLVLVHLPNLVQNLPGLGHLLQQHLG
jgi:competence protein ComGC